MENERAAGWGAGGEGQDPEWASLDLRDATRFKSNAARHAQEAAWAATNIDARQNWAVREAIQIHGRQLRRTLLDLRVARTLAAGLTQPDSSLWGLPAPLLVAIAAFESHGVTAEFASSWDPEAVRAAKRVGRGSNILICARKRPLLAYEVAREDWEAVEMWRRDPCVVCHDGRLCRSGRKVLMTHRRFPLDHVWPATSGTEEVYQDVVVPLVDAAANRGRSSTLLCMGQTGTGKTFTMCGIIESLARDLRGCDVEVSFLEVYGKKCLDLLADRAVVPVREDGAGNVHACGQRVAHLQACEGLIELLTSALQLRASEATERNASSSRSHAICSVSLVGGGVLRLVDLAGSERNYETTQMTGVQHRESAQINSSLMALKNCFRVFAEGERHGARPWMPFRASRLTQLLKDCFVDEQHLFVVVATLAPAATDLTHSVNTLRHAVMLSKPCADAAVEATVELSIHTGGAAQLVREKPVDQWTPEDVLTWLCEAECGRFDHLVVPPGLDGRTLLGCNAAGLASLFEGSLRQARGANEGEAWTVQTAAGGMYDEEGISAAASRAGADLGRQLFLALRRVAFDQDQA